MAEQSNIIVLGMHRSGTSLIASLVDKLGFYNGGNENLMPPAEDNPLGFFEYIPLVEMNKDLLEEAGGSWLIPPQSDKLEELARHPGYIKRANNLIKSLNAVGQQWYLKDPRLIYTWPFWKHFIRNPRVLYVIRHPESVAASLSKRDGMSQRQGRNFWLLNAKLASDVIADLPVNDLYSIDYDSLLESPEEILADFVSFLFTKNHSIDLGELMSTIKKNLRHNAGLKNINDENVEAVWQNLKSGQYSNIHYSLGQDDVKELEIIEKSLDCKSNNAVLMRYINGPYPFLISILSKNDVTRFSVRLDDQVTRTILLTRESASLKVEELPIMSQVDLAVFYETDNGTEKLSMTVTNAIWKSENDQHFLFGFHKGFALFTVDFQSMQEKEVMCFVKIKINRVGYEVIDDIVQIL